MAMAIKISLEEARAFEEQSKQQQSNLLNQVDNNQMGDVQPDLQAILNKNIDDLTEEEQCI